MILFSLPRVSAGSLTRVFLALCSFSLWKRAQEPDVSVTCRVWDSGCFFINVTLEHLQQNVQGGSLTRVFLELWSFSLWKRPQEPDVSVTCRLGLAFVYILNCFLNIYCLIKIALFKLALALKK